MLKKVILPASKIIILKKSLNSRQLERMLINPIKKTMGYNK